MTSYIDGVCQNTGMSDLTYKKAREVFNSRMSKTPEVEITLSKEYNVNTGAGTVTATIKNASLKSNVAGTFHFAICQKDSLHKWGQSMSGVEDTIYSVCFMMLPDYNGTDVSISAGNSEVVTEPFTIGAGWQRDDCYAVGIMQGADKEILQAVEIPLDDATDVQPQVIPVSEKAMDLFSFRVHQQMRSISIRLNYSDAVISVVNCAGVLQKQEQGSKRKVHLSLQDISSGMYFCVVQADGYREEKKFLLY